MTSALEPGKWTMRRWIYAVTGVLLLQLALVALLVRPPRPVTERPPFATQVHLLADDEIGRLPAFVDPALFALPSLHGFSGSAWLRFSPLEYALTEPAQAPAGLKLDPAALGSTFSQYLSSNTIAPPLLVDEPLPSVLRLGGPNFSIEPVAPYSQLQIDGGLAGRPLVESLELPSWPNTEVISNTVVRATVDATGRSFSATLLSRSGLAAADEYALRFVETARFKPLPLRPPGRPSEGNRLTWGLLNFHWHTLPMPLTNALPEVP